MKTARQTYDRLWREAIPRFERGEPQTDPHLADRAGDDRRSVTLALRPEFAVQASVELFLRQLAAVAPGQHFYQPGEGAEIRDSSNPWRRRSATSATS